MTSHNYDVAIVGGGAAGLSAALVLAKSRRDVVIVDAGKPRNAPAGTILVHTAQESMRTCGILYGPDMAEPPLRATTGPISLYAPVLKLAST